jgi:hypothetical protein
VCFQNVRYRKVCREPARDVRYVKALSASTRVSPSFVRLMTLPFLRHVLHLNSVSRSQTKDNPGQNSIRIDSRDGICIDIRWAGFGRALPIVKTHQADLHGRDASDHITTPVSPGTVESGSNMV